MSESKYTALPLRLTTRFDFKRDYERVWRHKTSEVVDNAGNVIGALIYQPEIQGQRNRADFIVRACNCHYELLEALSDVMGLIDNQWLVRNIKDDAGADWARRQIEPTRKLRDAHTVLAKVKELENE